MRKAPAVCGLVVAADALVHLGGLEPAFAATAMALNSGGLIPFSLEACEGDGFRLGASMRFAHGRAYVEQTAAAVGLRPIRIEEASTRRERGREAPGLVCVFARG
jgi:predicted TPR repeat methyltransferase